MMTFSKTVAHVCLTAGLLITFASLSQTGEAQVLAESVQSSQSSLDEVFPYLKDYRRPSSTPYPEDNPESEASYELGRNLFFDPRLSGSNWISCATCHNPGFAWEDGLPKAIGHGMQELKRGTQTLLNLAWGELFFWDGRAFSLEEQALAPVEAEGEMNLNLNAMITKIQAIPGYAPLFEAAYPEQGISEETVAKALANFQRSLVSEEAPFDRWVKGDKRAISEQAQLGFKVFNEKAECAVCHGGWRFTDDGFHDIGVVTSDRGRGALLEDIDSLQFAFKTPTLRNIAQRAPYLHNGSERTLMDVVEFYNRGGNIKRPSVSEHVKPLGLSEQEKAALVAFMQSLTSQDRPVAAPMLPQ